MHGEKSRVVVARVRTYRIRNLEHSLAELGAVLENLLNGHCACKGV
jgi:hypothetical protein